jgi:hypothetical protein
VKEDKVMNLIRRIFSLILLIGSVVALIGMILGSGSLFQPFIDSLNPFDFSNMATELAALITGHFGIAFMMFILGFIGLTMPSNSKR